MGDARDPVLLVRRLGGKAGTAEIVAACGRYRLRRAVSAGRLRRAARGVYVEPRLPPALVVAARCRAVVSHASAAAIWRLDQVREPSSVHLTIPHGSRRRLPEGVTLHRTRHVAPGDVVEGVTSPLRTVLDCAATMPFAEALAIADSALATRQVEADQLRAAALRRAGPGRARIARVALAADRRAENAFESVLRARIVEAGIVGFEPQLHIKLPGLAVVVDLAHPDLRIVLEADSYAYHGGRRSFARDCRRYNALVLAGWTVLRLSWEDVMFRGPAVVAAIRALMTTKRQARSRALVGSAARPRSAVVDS